MHKKRKLQDIYPYLLAIAVVFFVAVLNYYFPKSCDDLTFSFIPTSSIKNLLGSALRQGNGRLLGNFFGYLISMKKFTFAEKTFLWCGMIFLIIKLIGSKNIIINTVIAAVMIYPADSVFSQVYAWNSGFQNYAFPVFLILLDMLLMKTIIQKDTKQVRVLLIVPLILTAFAGQFFSENSSLFAVGLAAAVLLYCIKYKKSAAICAAGYLVSAAAGFAVMLTYPHILGTSEKISSYRGYADSFSTFLSLAQDNYRLISREFARFFILWIIVSAAYILVIHKILLPVFSGLGWKTALCLSETIIAAYPVLSLFYDVLIKNSITFPRYYFNSFLCISFALYIVALAFVSLLLFRNAADKIPSALFFLALFSAAPLLVVSPIGARTFYIPYICLFLSGICILSKYADELHFNEKLTGCACLLALCCALSVLAMAVVDNRYCSDIRESYLASEIKKGNEDIVLPLLPHQNLIHDDSNNGAWNFYVAHRYEKEVSYRFVEWNQWYAECYKSSNE